MGQSGIYQKLLKKATISEQELRSFAKHDFKIRAKSYKPSKYRSVLYEKTMKRIKRIKEGGYNVKFVWEHDFVRVESSKMRLEDIDIVKVL